LFDCLNVFSATVQGSEQIILARAERSTNEYEQIT
jgi:hypothetical protein